MSQWWGISDTHFGHKNILDYEPSRRAWGSTIEEHDRAIIEVWRAVVAPSDSVLHCGDFALSNRERIAAIVAQLTGRITIVLGNHDRGHDAMLSLGFFDVRKSLTWDGEFGRVVARHAPASFTEEECSTADVLLHGHLHGHVPTDGRHAYPNDPAVRAKLVDASIEGLPTAPGPMRLHDLIQRHLRNTAPLTIGSGS